MASSRRALGPTGHPGRQVRETPAAVTGLIVAANRGSVVGADVAVDGAGAGRPGPRAAVLAGTVVTGIVGTGIVGTWIVATGALVPGRSGSATAVTGAEPLAPLIPAPPQAGAATANKRIAPALHRRR